MRCASGPTRRSSGRARSATRACSSNGTRLSTQGIEAITDVWQGATQRLSGLDPQVAALNDVKFLAALMREYAGRERALVGAGKPIEPEKRLDVADWRARVGLTWEQINSIFPKATAPAAITAAVAAVNERFFGNTCRCATRPT